MKDRLLPAGAAHDWRQQLQTLGGLIIRLPVAGTDHRGYGGDGRMVTKCQKSMPQYGDAGQALILLWHRAAKARTSAAGDHQRHH